MRGQIDIDLHNNDKVWAWECHYIKDEKHLRKIIFSEGDTRHDGELNVEISIKTQKEFDEYIRFFKIPKEQIHITSSPD